MKRKGILLHLALQVAFDAKPVCDPATCARDKNMYKYLRKWHEKQYIYLQRHLEVHIWRTVLTHKDG